LSLTVVSSSNIFPETVGDSVLLDIFKSGALSVSSSYVETSPYLMFAGAESLSIPA